MNITLEQRITFAEEQIVKIRQQLEEIQSIRRNDKAWDVIEIDQLRNLFYDFIKCTAKNYQRTPDAVRTKLFHFLSSQMLGGAE